MASIFEVSLCCDSLNSEAGGLSSANQLSFNVCVFSVTSGGRRCASFL